jgi:hypothetical protein
MLRFTSLLFHGEAALSTNKDIQLSNTVSSEQLSDSDIGIADRKQKIPGHPYTRNINTGGSDQITDSHLSIHNISLHKKTNSMV